MRSRRKSLFERVIDLVPVVVVAGAGAIGVFVAMNILVTAPPVGIARSPSPSPSALTSFPDTLSFVPLVPVVPSDTPAPTASLTNQQPRFVHSVINESDPGGVWTVYLSYPAFILGETPWAQTIDTDIRGETSIRAAQWEAGPAADRRAPGKTNTLIGTFTTEMVTPTLASWTLTWVDDSSAGGPVSGVETLNYDLGTGQRIVLDDIFIDSTSAITVMSDLAPGLLKSQLGADYVATVVNEGTSPLSTNWDHWALTKTGLKITFAQYQVARGTAMPSIIVPWNQLESVMNPTGPVAKLAGL
jgi:hypothetical protein